MKPFWVRSIIVGLFVGIAAFAAVPIMHHYQSVLERVRNWIVHAERYAVSPVVRDVFDSAVRSGIIFYDPESDDIIVSTPREYAVNGVSGRQSQQVLAPFSSDTAIDLLYQRRGAGAEIRQIIETYQTRRTLIAIRDAGVTPACRALRAGSCPERPWRISLPSGSARSPVSSSLAVTALDPYIFRSFRQRGQGYSAWTLVRGGDLTERRFVLTPDVELQSQWGAQNASDNMLVTLDLIGRVVDPPAEAQVTPFCLLRVKEPQQLRLQRGTRLTPCADVSLDHEDVRGSRIVLPRERALAGISVQPVVLPALPPDVRAHVAQGDLLEVLNADQNGAPLARGRDGISSQSDLAQPLAYSRFSVRLDDRIGLICGNDQCVPELRISTSRITRLARDLAHSERVEQNIREPGDEVGLSDEDVEGDVFAEILTTSAADARFLTPDAPGSLQLTDAAIDLGLAAEIGIPGVSRGSYLGFLENLPSGVVASDLELTFSPEMQMIARDVFRQVLVEQSYGPTQGHLLGGAEEDRRAAFTLIDLRRGPDLGAVRIAVGYPVFDESLSLFDLQAFTMGAEGDSPVAAPAWRGLDSRFQPGSSIKILSALSLARSITGLNSGVSPEMARRLRTAFLGATSQQYRRLFGLRGNATSFKFETARGRPGRTSIADRGAAFISRAGGAPSTATHCGHPNVDQLSVCEALARSSNMWFAAMALNENDGLLDNWASAQRDLSLLTGLGQTLQALGLGQARPLVRLPRGIDVEDTLAPRMEAPRIPSAPGLRGAPPSDFSIDLPDLAVVQNAYGQNMTITPLAMASIAGSIGMRGGVAPFIARTRDSAVPGLLPILGEDEFSDVLYDEIRRGMQGVMRPGGTGYNRFRAAGQGAQALSERVFAKTGTALRSQQGVRNEYSHWFVGWVETETGTPTHAFACVISHVASGRGPCPATTGAILQALGEAGLLD